MERKAKGMFQAVNDKHKSKLVKHVLRPSDAEKFKGHLEYVSNFKKKRIDHIKETNTINITNWTKNRKEPAGQGYRERHLTPRTYRRNMNSVDFQIA